MTVKKLHDVVKSTDVIVTKGSHLTVFTYPDGRTELRWNDQALARDVALAIASVEQPIAKKTSRRSSSKKVKLDQEPQLIKSKEKKTVNKK
jgi:hypothetical protein